MDKQSLLKRYRRKKRLALLGFGLTALVSGVVFVWTTTADDFFGLLTGYPGDYNYRWDIVNGAFVVTPQLKNIDAPTPGPGPIL